MEKLTLDASRQKIGLLVVFLYLGKISFKIKKKKEKSGNPHSANSNSKIKQKTVWET